MNFRKILDDMGLKVETDIIADDLISALNIFSVPEGYFLREWEDLKNFFQGRFNEGESLKVLSVGCGRGEEVYTIKYLCEKLNLNCYVVGLDLSLKNLIMAKGGIYTSFSLRGERENFLIRWGNMWRVPFKYWKGNDFVLGNLLRLPFKDRSFDAVICKNTLMYIREEFLRRALEEMERVSRFVYLGKFDVLHLKNLGIL
jgi:chemotaxis protein methyltransferase CheR